ncbi:hypothetical protein DFH08DRAFT_873761 [Mycena albidolilacea]|uniref:DUF6533 domain-containing protein n=1 Tax=Mycena albidolilacea TaxID=1033008 RepID=A0AAD6ZWB5_9AGAR|nr:hypothetical protein DFH08DRAFT_873761 [Mycena albidolilacea]
MEQILVGHRGIYISLSIRVRAHPDFTREHSGFSWDHIAQTAPPFCRHSDLQWYHSLLSVVEGLQRIEGAAIFPRSRVRRPLMPNNPNYLRGSAMAALTWVVYDVCLSLDREIVSVWRSSWSLSKILFLFSRYHTILSLGFFLMECIGTKHFLLPLVVSFDGTPPPPGSFGPCIANLPVAKASRWYIGLTEVFSILAGELLILIRINTVYGWSRKSSSPYVWQFTAWKLDVNVASGRCAHAVLILWFASLDWTGYHGHITPWRFQRSFWQQEHSHLRPRRSECTGRQHSNSCTSRPQMDSQGLIKSA